MAKELSLEIKRVQAALQQLDRYAELKGKLKLHSVIATDVRIARVGPGKTTH